MGWQVWNLWSKDIFASCAEESFHPLGRITSQEWEEEVERIDAIKDPLVRSTQAANLQQIKELRDTAQQAYMQEGHSWDQALLEATSLLKSIGVCNLAGSAQAIICQQTAHNKLLQGFYAIAWRAANIDFSSNMWNQFKMEQEGLGSAGLYDPRWHPKAITLLNGQAQPDIH